MPVQKNPGEFVAWSRAHDLPSVHGPVQRLPRPQRPGRQGVGGHMLDGAGTRAARWSARHTRGPLACSQDALWAR
jgi:hypothetical protein